MELFIAGIVGHLVTAAWEHWLGKTDSITENSTVDLAKKLTVKALRKITKA